MRILRKDGANILVVASPAENVRLGDYLMVSDKEERSLILQIYDESYLDVSGIEEEVAREEVLFASTQGVTEDPADVGTISKEIRDMRLLHCKARGSIEHGRYSPRNDWIPSRTASKVSKLNINELLDTVGRPGERMMKIGRTGSRSQQFSIPAEALDGRVTIITGRKESGKSHLAKMMARGLVQQGAYCIIFDLNDEYGSIGTKADGGATEIAKKVEVRRPGRNLKFSLSGAGLRAITSLLQHSLDMTGTSIREFIRIWEAMDAKHEVGMTSLGNYIQQWRCNEFVRDALYSRFHTLSNSGIFYEGKPGDPDFREEDAMEAFFAAHPDGGALVISLTRTSPLNRRMTVELVLSKLVELLEHRKIPPVFLLSEEAHLYLRDTYWEDLITRMRHFGVFTTFVTNQPDAIKQEIYRQADNIFLYNFSNEADLNLVSQASMVDTDTVRSIVRTLPPRMCLVLGHAVNNLPVLVTVDEFDSPPSGITRRFFEVLAEVAPLAR
jgi:Helicase HerA, central domain